MNNHDEQSDMKYYVTDLADIAQVGEPLPQSWKSSRVTVTTESGSCHLVDLSDGIYRRLRSPHDPSASELRQDGETIQLLAACLPEVGKPWLLWITGLNPDADMTTRTTTEITEIEWLDEPGAMLVG